MRTETIINTIYKFEELSKEAQQKVIDNWYEGEDYPFLNDDLTEGCHELLKEKGVECTDIKLFYSLSWSQGDGLCFTGQLEKNGQTLKLTHNYRYYHAKSVTMELTDSEGEEIDIEEGNELVSIYFEVCRELEKRGYAELEYRMSIEEFTDHAEANQYEYYENGKPA